MADAVRRTKPIAGALWGVPLGFGLALLAINAKLISLAIIPIVITVLIGVAIGVLWSMYGPAKAAKGDPA